METYSLDLFCVSPSKEEPIFSPLSHIYVKNSSATDAPDAAKGLQLITSECVSLREVEYEIDQLKRELEEIRKKAKRKYAAHDKLVMSR